MIELLIVWLYLAFICFAIGYAVSSLCEKCLKIKFEGLFINCVLGFVSVTVIAEYMSLFINIGKLSVTVLGVLALVSCVISYAINKKRIPTSRQFAQLQWTYIVLFISLVILGIYYSVMTLTQEGQAGDTYLYHAQAVRWIDDYGCVKGIANLNTRLGFNNASFAFHAIGTFNEIFETKMHCSMGFLFLMFSMYVVERTIIDVRKQKYTNILFYIACLFYVLKNAEVCSTYLTDYPANIMSAIVLIEWISTFDEADSKRGYKQAVISVLCVFLATLKFSFCFLIILALMPGVWMIRKRDWKRVIAFVICGILVLIPFVLRNAIVSGWILYPFAGLDILNVEWKLPVELVENEAFWVYSWGRLPGEANTVLTMHSGAFAWLPAWFKHLSVVQKAEVMLALLATMTIMFGVVHDRIKNLKISERGCQYRFVLSVVVLNLAYWFVSAPDIRFVSILLTFVIFITPMLMLETKTWKNNELYRTQLTVIAVMFVIAEMACSTPIVQTAIYIDSVDNVKHLLADHQIWQYDYSNDIKREIDGKIIYEMIESTPAYHELPTIYGASDSDEYEIYFMGESIEDGFAIRQYEQ